MLACPAGVAMTRQGVDLVTGGAGFVGSHVVAALVTRGRRIIVLDNLSTGSAANLNHIPPADVELVVGDVAEPALLARLLARAERVLHLACVNLRRSLRAPFEADHVNAGGTLALLEAARTAGIKRFVHVSSSEVYGSALSAPMGEHHPLQPTTPYGGSKLAGEAYARAFHCTYGLPVTVVRPFNAYGPRAHHEGDSGEVIPRFIVRALAGEPLVVFGDGLQTRDFTHVTDTVEGIVAAADAPAAVGGTYNIGSGVELSILELARRVLRATGARPDALCFDRARPGDVRRLVADIALARRELGFTPRTPLDEGLGERVAEYRARGAAKAREAATEIADAWRPEQLA